MVNIIQHSVWLFEWVCLPCNILIVIYIANKSGYGDTLSWWYNSNGGLNVVMQPDMKYAPTKVVRTGDRISITSSINFKGDVSDTPAGEKLTYAEFAAKGIEDAWSGIYNIDGRNVKVSMQVYSDSYSPNYSLNSVISSDKQKFLQAEIHNETGRSAQTVSNWPLGLDFWSSWSIKSPGHINLYTSMRYSNVSYKSATDSSPYSGQEFESLVAHEFGHTMGISDAYGEKGYRKAAPSCAAPSNDMMRVNGGVVSNVDVDKVLGAYMNNKWQEFPQGDSY